MFPALWVLERSAFYFPRFPCHRVLAYYLGSATNLHAQDLSCGSEAGADFLLHWLVSKAKGTGRVPQRCLSVSSFRVSGGSCGGGSRTSRRGSVRLTSQVQAWPSGPSLRSTPLALAIALYCLISCIVSFCSEYPDFCFLHRTLPPLKS